MRNVKIFNKEKGNYRFFSLKPEKAKEIAREGDIFELEMAVDSDGGAGTFQCLIGNAGGDVTILGERGETIRNFIV